MRIFGVVAVIALFLAGPAWGQQKNIPKYGETEGKSASEIAADKEAEKAYQKSLGNIPEQKSGDPWGTVRSDNAPPKPAAKAAAAKPKAKVDNKVESKADSAAKQ